MVRLKVMRVRYMNYFQQYFNSYMVRLKEFNNPIKRNITTFQFLYGTIKRRGNKIACYRVNNFQFLYGTIKREDEFADAVIRLLFQFLYGTIKSIDPSKFNYAFANFNSYMVRLKD